MEKDSKEKGHSTYEDHIENINCYIKRPHLAVQQGKLRWGRTWCEKGLPGSGSGMGFARNNKTWHSFGSPYRNLVLVADYVKEHSGRACRGKKWVKTRAAIWNSHAIRGFTEDALTGAQCVGRLVSWFIFNPIFGKNLAFTAACHLIQFKFYYKSFP